MAHSILGASSAHRWMNCTQSINLYLKYKDKLTADTSSYAKEGTLAHKIAEYIIEHNRTDIPVNMDCLSPYFSNYFSNFINHTAYDEPNYEIALNSLDEGTKKYINDFISYFDEKIRINFNFESKEEQRLYEIKNIELIFNCLKYTIHTYFFTDEYLYHIYGIEKTFKYNFLNEPNSDEKSKGTVDFYAYCKNTKQLTIIDLKYGAGVSVSAQNNPQLKLYGLAVMDYIENEYDYKVDTIKLCIFQPRVKNPIKSETLSRFELEQFRGSVMFVKKQIDEGQFNFKMDYKTCKFCPVKHLCPEQLKTLDILGSDDLEKSNNTDGTIDYEHILSNKANIVATLDEIEQNTIDEILQTKEPKYGFTVKETKGRSKLSEKGVEYVKSELGEDCYGDKPILALTKLKTKLKTRGLELENEHLETGKTSYKLDRLN